LNNLLVLDVKNERYFYVAPPADTLWAWNLAPKVGQNWPYQIASFPGGPDVWEWVKGVR